MLKTLMKSKIAEQEALVRAAMDEKRAMTDEEQTKFNALQTEIDSLEKTIEAAKKLDDQQAKMNAPVNQPIYAEPKKADTDKPFATFGEQMLAIVKAGRPGGEIDARLLQIQAAASGASEGVPSDGGFLVQKDFSDELIRNVFETGILVSRCRRIPISRNSNGIKINGVDEKSRANGSRWGGVQAYWANEADTVTATKPKFRQIELTLNKLMALYYATDELLQDSVAMESVLLQAFTEEIQFKVDDAIVWGPGAGQPLGILKANCLVVQAKEAGQAADTIVHQNINKMWSRMIARSRANAVWFINQECEPQLNDMTIAVGTGGTLSPFAIEYMTKGTIKGAPVIPIEHCSALGDQGDMILTDLGQYLLGDKGGMQTASSIHVQFLYDETAFRITYRVDGQPVRDSAITPYKGANTLSSFVTLAERA